ncbi:MAG: hypothetical protein FWF59_14370 [Turicibacter sp.]|nr:hypothetical protein [Turicibacter sp.]
MPKTLVGIFLHALILLLGFFRCGNKVTLELNVDYQFVGIVLPESYYSQQSVSFPIIQKQILKHNLEVLTEKQGWKRVDLGSIASQEKGWISFRNNLFDIRLIAVGPSEESSANSRIFHLYYQEKEGNVLYILINYDVLVVN